MSRYKYNLHTGEIYEGDVLLGTFTPSPDGGRKLRMLSLVMNANRHNQDEKSGKLALARLTKNFVKQANTLISDGDYVEILS